MQYLNVSREIKRLESVTKSPVYVLLSESVQGLSVIRSFQQENRMMLECCKRVDVMNRCYFYLWTCNRWLNFRTQMLSTLVCGFVGLFCVLYYKSLTGTAAGMALMFSIELGDNITFFVRQYADVQLKFNSIGQQLGIYTFTYESAV